MTCYRWLTIAEIAQRRWRMAVWIFFMVIPLLNCMLSQKVHADSRTVQARGIAAVTRGNTAIAGDNALNDALRKAVEQAVGMMVSAETLVENYQVLSDSIYTKSRGYVQNYRVIDEGPLGGGMYQVTVEAVVTIGDLKDDLDALGLLHKQSGKPRVLFMIAEQNVGQRYYVFWWWGKSEYAGEEVDLSIAETTLKEEFANNGFNVVDISAVTGRLDISKAFRMADLTDDGARSIGRQFGAEVVIKGKSIAKEGPRTRGSSVGSYLADMTATAIRVDNGQVIASGRGHGVSRHISGITGGTEAIERAAKELAGKMIDQIVTKWSGEVGGGGIIQVTVRGIGDFKELVRFKEAIKTQVRGVQSVYQRSFEGGVAVLDVEMKGTGQTLADEIAVKDYGFPVSVEGTTSRTIEVRIGE